MQRNDDRKSSITFHLHLVILFLAAVLMRWALLDGYHPEMETLQTRNAFSAAHSAFFFGDAKSYFTDAEALSKSGSFGAPYRPPLYTAMLALTFSIFPADFLVAHVVQIILGSLIAVLFALLARRWFSPLAGILTGWLTAVSFQLAILSATLCSETLFLVLIAGALLLLESRLLLCRSLAGLILGLSILTRPEGAVFVLIVVLVEFFRRKGWRGRLVAAVFLLMTVLTWSVRNYFFMEMKFPETSWKKKIVPVSANGPINFYLGNGPMASGGYRTFSNAMHHDLPADTVNFNDPVHREAFYNGFQAGLDHLIMEPGRVKELLHNKTRFFARGLRAGFGIANFPWGLRGSLRRGDMWSTENPLSVWLLAVLALAGWVAAIRKHPRAVILSAGFALTSFGNAIVFFGLARNAAMMLPFFFMGVSVLIGSVVMRAGNGTICRKMIRATGWLMVLWLVALSAWLAVSPVVLPTTNGFFAGLPSLMEISTDDQRKTALARYETTLAEVDAADNIVIMEEGLSNLLTRLVMLINGEDRDRMDRFLDRALDLDPSNAEAWKIKGFLALGDPEREPEGIQSLRRYIQINPWAPDVAGISEMLARKRAGL